MLIRLGSRKSKLALTQAALVAEALQQASLTFSSSPITCEIVPIITTGDLITNKNLYDIGGKALFLKELEQALADDKIDIAVHSLKDVPGRLHEQFILAAVLERADARDAFISLKARSIKELPLHSKVGSSSPRRKALLQNTRPDLEIVTFRGNVESRLQKLLQVEVDATILATAGLERLGLFDESYCHILQVEEMLPAAGQGAIALEIIAGNTKMQELCKRINHQLTWDVIQAERAFLEYLDADCKTPLAAYARSLGQDKLQVDFMLSDASGKLVFHSDSGVLEDSAEIGIDAAKFMLKKLG